MKVYISPHRMSDTNNGWDLTDSPAIQIHMNEALLLSLFEGFYEDQFILSLLIYEPIVFEKLKQIGSDEENVYFGFWLEEGNQLFQVQMMLLKGKLRKKSEETIAKLTYCIDGFPEILPIACSEQAVC